MTEFKDKILNKIEQEKITPKPRWVFLLKDSVYWGLFALATIIGGFAIAPFLHVSQEVDFLSTGSFKLIFSSLPYVWLVFLAIFVWVAWYNAKHTRRGYCCHPALIVAGSMIVSIVLGYLLLLSGIGEKIDNSASRNLPSYPSCMQRSMKVWQNPQEGTLSGDIKKIIDSNFILVDFNGKQWLIDDSQASWTKPEVRKVGEKIKMTGSVIGEGKFKAQVIKPWTCGCAAMGRSEQDCRNGNCAGSCVK